MEDPNYLKAAFYVAIMLSVVPITGLLVFGGNVRQAWRYTKTWFAVVGALAAAGIVIALILYPLIG